MSDNYLNSSASEKRRLLRRKMLRTKTPIRVSKEKELDLVTYREKLIKEVMLESQK